MDVFSYLLGRKSGGGGGSPGGGGGGGGGGSNEDWIIGDGNTHLWITLQEGRTSPMLGVCPNGTVTVDWGDGSAPDVLTGTSTSTVVYTPNHAYAKAGDYVITLTVDGEMGFSGVSESFADACILRHSSASDSRNGTYQNALKKIEMGNNVRTIGNRAFTGCFGLTSVTMSSSVTSMGGYAFAACYSLRNIIMSINIPSIVDDTFQQCYSLTNLTIPDSVRTIGQYSFDGCRALTSITIPNGVTSIGQRAFQTCTSLVTIVIPNGVTSIARGTFAYCNGAKFYDFTNHTTVPTLLTTDAFSNIPADAEIRVPAALVDEWKAATNWSTYADNIVGV